MDRVCLPTPWNEVKCTIAHRLPAKFGEYMISTHTTDVAVQAKTIHGRELQAKLEASHPNRYVAIEPESGEYFVAESFGEAVAAARTVHPDRIAFVIRIGHPAALSWGGLTI